MLSRETKPGSFPLAEGAMETFFMVLTLSSLTGPQVTFFSHPKQWNNELA
jgi:hypothetical protein